MFYDCCCACQQANKGTYAVCQLNTTVYADEPVAISVLGYASNSQIARKNGCDNIGPDPTRPDPWMDPTRVQL